MATGTVAASLETAAARPPRDEDQIMSTPPLADRIALVTGASRGIGRATALALARAGAHVVAVARTVGGLEELDDAIRAGGGSATLVPLDLKDTPGIVRLAAALAERYQRLDVLIGNAGILGPLSPLGHVEPKAWDEALAVNLTANWQLIRALDPLLRRSTAARVVFVSSGIAARPRAYWGPYAVSKAALEALARTYAAETVSTHVRVNLFNPGATRTRMRATAMPGEDPAGIKTPEPVAEQILELCLPQLQETGGLFEYRRG
jgi:NAD(P)-dependent dehydrogenase (short-subunit alcohol dehydrogenase family)